MLSWRRYDCWPTDPWSEPRRGAFPVCVQMFFGKFSSKQSTADNLIDVSALDDTLLCRCAGALLRLWVKIWDALRDRGMNDEWICAEYHSQRYVLWFQFGSPQICLLKKRVWLWTTADAVMHFQVFDVGFEFHTQLPESEWVWWTERWKKNGFPKMFICQLNTRVFHLLHKIYYFSFDCFVSDSIRPMGG